MRWTDDEVKQYIDFVYDQGKTRAKAQGSKFDDVDFAMGAAVALKFMDRWDQLPAGWVFLPMSGRPIFSEESPQQHTAVLARLNADDMLSVLKEIAAWVQRERDTAGHTPPYWNSKLQEVLDRIDEVW